MKRKEVILTRGRERNTNSRRCKFASSNVIIKITWTLVT